MPLINRVGGGCDVSGVTAAAEHVRKGYMFVDADGEEKEGTLPDGTYDETFLDKNGKPIISMGINSDGIVAALFGHNDGYFKGRSYAGSYQLPVVKGQTFVPGDKEQTIVEAGKFTTGDIKMSPAQFYANTTNSANSKISATEIELETGFTRKPSYIAVVLASNQTALGSPNILIKSFFIRGDNQMYWVGARYSTGASVAGSGDGLNYSLSMNGTRVIITLKGTGASFGSGTYEYMVY